METQTSLTLPERNELTRLETIIENGRRSFIEVGTALMKIRDLRLYRQTHKTFEEYCKRKWGFFRDQADRLINAAKVNKNLTPIGVIPTSESQLRPLTHLPSEQQKEVWKEAVDTAPEGKVTARHVEEIIKKKRHPPIITPLAIEQVNDEVRRTFEAFFEAIQRAKRNHWEGAPKAAIKKLLDNLEGFLI